MPSPVQHQLDYAVPPPEPRPFWRSAVEVVFGLGGLVGVAFGFMSVAIVTGLWEEPSMVAGIAAGILAILMFTVSAAMAGRWCNEG